MSTPRRGFLKSLVAAPLLPAALVGPQATPQPQPVPPFAPTPSPEDPTPGPVAEALGEAVRHRYGTHLEPGDLDEIKKAIEANLRAADRLSKLKLGNADEPVTVFQARPPAANKGSGRRAPGATASFPPRRD